MIDRIDPGPGWRLLGRRECIVAGDQYRFNGGWRATSRDGCVPGTMIYRRRIASPSTTKAIATRATTTMAFRDGRSVSRTERNDSGLVKEQMINTMRAWDSIRLVGVKYIMLEIQREGEP